jgi:hypothetical protein
MKKNLNSAKVVRLHTQASTHSMGACHAHARTNASVNQCIIFGGKKFKNIVFYQWLGLSCQK